MTKADRNQQFSYPKTFQNEFTTRVIELQPCQTGLSLQDDDINVSGLVCRGVDPGVGRDSKHDRRRLCGSALQGSRRTQGHSQRTLQRSPPFKGVLTTKLRILSRTVTSYGIDIAV